MCVPAQTQQPSMHPRSFALQLVQKLTGRKNPMSQPGQVIKATGPSPSYSRSGGSAIGAGGSTGGSLVTTGG